MQDAVVLDFHSTLASCVSMLYCQQLQLNIDKTATLGEDALLCFAGVRLVASPEPTPVATILAPTTPTTTPMAILQGHSLVNNVLLKKTLNTFSTPVPTPEETPAPSVPTLKELLLKAYITISLAACG